jgi:A/G-specific adenine glycosylase
MESFPTVEALANATPEEVNSHWAGLGFYRRARLLHQGAKRVVEDYDGVVPNTVEELMKVSYLVLRFICVHHLILQSN